MYIYMVMMTATLETKDWLKVESSFPGNKSGQERLYKYINILMVLAKKYRGFCWRRLVFPKTVPRGIVRFYFFKCRKDQSDRSDDDHCMQSLDCSTVFYGWMCVRISVAAQLQLKGGEYFESQSSETPVPCCCWAAALILSNWVPSTCNWTGKKSKKPSTAVLRLCVNWLSDFRRGRITSALIISTSLQGSPLGSTKIGLPQWLVWRWNFFSSSPFFGDVWSPPLCSTFLLFKNIRERERKKTCMHFSIVWATLGCWRSLDEDWHLESVVSSSIRQPFNGYIMGQFGSSQTALSFTTN